jgi:hypothetical protein
MVIFLDGESGLKVAGTFKKRRVPMAYYRCYIFRDTGEWFAIADIISDTHDDAIRQAAELSDRRPFELQPHDQAVHRQMTDAEAQSAAATPLAALVG